MSKAERVDITGTSNRILEVDLTRKEAHLVHVSDEDRKMYLGGKGLGLKLLYDRLPTGVDPLGEKNYLAFMMGVLMGTGAPCSGRFSGLTKSPLTGIMTVSSCGGPFGMALKTAGYDGLLITGRSPAPMYLVIDSRGVAFKDAAHLWGMDTGGAQEALQLDKKEGALAIGPAGENQVNIANIASGHRFLGRGGMGAVMGAKHLKAVVAKGGEMRILPRDVGEFGKIKKRAIRYINKNRFTSHTYRKFGTSANVDWCNEGGILPVNNFTAGRHEMAEKVSGETMARRYRTRHRSCKPCTILCGHKGTLEDGTVHGIPEYETVGLLGTNLGNFDPDQIVHYNDICNRMGMDTISAGGVLGYTMEAGEKGLIDTPLRFGTDEGVANALLDMARRRGFGDAMANGIRWMSEKYGGKSFAIQVKGLEMAAYDPRGAWGQGLSYAVANRGACHLSSTTFAPEVMFGFLNPYTTRAKAPFVVFFENLYAAINSLQTCLFTSYAYLLEPPMVKYTPRFLLKLNMRYLPGIATRLMDVSIYSGLYGSVTGIKMSPRDFLRAGARIHTLERFMNTREGVTRRDDILPERFLKEGRAGDPKQRVVPLDRMLADYYRLRGYDSNGIPALKTLNGCGIEHREEAKTLEANGAFSVKVPNRSVLTRIYLSFMFGLTGRAIQTASRVDREIKTTVRDMHPEVVCCLGVTPGGPYMVLVKDRKGRLRYLRNSSEMATIYLDIKTFHTAMRLFTFRVGFLDAIRKNEVAAAGDFEDARMFLHVLDRVNVVLLPKVLAKRVVNRYPEKGRLKKHLNRMLLYFLMLIGI